MSKYYREYVWKDGIPYGIDPAEEIASIDSYKIIMDPYRKRISVEKYAQGSFSALIYDSALLDFRHLKTPEHTAWQKLPITESEELMVCLIRDQVDRILFIETHLFVNSLCRECRVNSPHGVSLSVHKMYYKLLGDNFDGVILFDQNEHPVMLKRYEFSEPEMQFTALLEENWAMEKQFLYKYIDPKKLIQAG